MNLRDMQRRGPDQLNVWKNKNHKTSKQLSKKKLSILVFYSAVHLTAQGLRPI